MSPFRRRELKRFDIPGHARYLTFSCYGRLALLANDRIKDALVDRLAFVRQQMDFQLLAWVVMPEHVHLLMVPGASSVTAVLRRLKAPFARQVLDRWRQRQAPILPRLLDARGQQRFWQHGGGYDRNIVGDEAVERTIDYIHANPIRRGLVKRVTDWPWSSARWYAGDREGQPRIDPLRM